mmetsp:Transcript_81864/g.226893  ORF Transcript_81864/g.226893 Transcript_81864/m.226893 type:complete len:225 (+) Transcript_81864:347-1021(+)
MRSAFRGALTRIHGMLGRKQNDGSQSGVAFRHQQTGLHDFVALHLLARSHHASCAQVPKQIATTIIDNQVVVESQTVADLLKEIYLLGVLQDGDVHTVVDGLDPPVPLEGVLRARVVHRAHRSHGVDGHCVDRYGPGQFLRKLLQFLCGIHARPSVGEIEAHDSNACSGQVGQRQVTSAVDFRQCVNWPAIAPLRPPWPSSERLPCQYGKEGRPGHGRSAVRMQ